MTEIFISIFDQDPSERARLVEMHCRAWPDLKPEVEALLEAHDRLRSTRSRFPDWNVG